MLDKPSQSTQSVQSGSGSPVLDFQEHLANLEAQGLLIRIDRPINKDTQLQPLVRWQFVGGIPEDERRAFLFTNVVDSGGKKFDIPVVVGALAASPRIYAAGMGTTRPEIGPAWLKAINNPIPPVHVVSPACQEVVIKGDDLSKPGGGMARLPVPISTPGFDCAPYLTATLCVTRDPDTGVQNMGTYRAGLKATDRLGVRMWARPGGAGGYLHWIKYRDMKQPMPIAIVIGAAPVVVFTGPQKLPTDVDEMAVAGGLAGQPIKVTKCVTSNLLVPADAEIVIEGMIDTSVLEPEAPFGESSGYVALEAFNMPMQVTAITHKRSPVFCSIISQVTPSESSVIKKVAYEPLFEAHLRQHLSIKSVRRVIMHEPLTNLRPVIFVQLAKGTPRTEVWRALHGTSNFLPNCGRIVIAISEDISPDNTDAIFWSLAYRCNPVEDVQLLPYRKPFSEADETLAEFDSSMLIDATAKQDFPPLSLPTKEFMVDARKIWEELGLPALNARPPWHGFSLGDWNETFDLFARRAVAGEWEKNGLDTLARQRGGLKPETLTSTVERPGK